MAENTNMVCQEQQMEMGFCFNFLVKNVFRVSNFQNAEKEKRFPNMLLLRKNRKKTEIN